LDESGSETLPTIKRKIYFVKNHRVFHSGNVMELVARQLNPHHFNLALLLVGEVCVVVQLGLHCREVNINCFS
jgi:hypothetical protein